MAELWQFDQSNERHLLSRAGPIVPTSFRLPNYRFEQPFALSRPTLNLIEELRGGQAPEFELHIHPRVAYRGPAPATDAPSAFGDPHSLRFRVEQAAWLAARAGIGIDRVLLVEVPVPASPSDIFADVHAHLLEAVAAFERGGRRGWKECVAALRDALEVWPESGSATPGEFSKRDTVSQRYTRIRRAVKHLTHLAHHPPGVEWQRSDALMALASVAGLLGATDEPSDVRDVMPGGDAEPASSPPGRDGEPEAESATKRD
ncbi:MAG: hypothetical protein KDB73_14950 [Planctomycetes bacterium]|nr:hypothetical protein [Planctomycetota bacterium]